MLFVSKRKEKPVQDFGTIIGKTAIFRGTISGHGKVTIKGTVEGTIEVLEEVVIEKEGSFKGKLVANDVAIAGHYSGKADVCGDVHLSESANVTCDLKARALISDEGAFFNGNCELHQKTTSSSLNDPLRLVKAFT